MVFTISFCAEERTNFQLYLSCFQFLSIKKTMFTLNDNISNTDLSGEHFSKTVSPNGLEISTVVIPFDKKI